MTTELDSHRAIAHSTAGENTDCVVAQPTTVTNTDCVVAHSTTDANSDFIVEHATTAVRKSEISMSVQALTTFDQNARVRRGTPVNHVLYQMGKILANSDGSAKTYELSRPVERIHAFISHNWVVPRWTKLLVLLYHFNFKTAVCVTGLGAIIGAVLTGLDLLPTRNHMALIGADPQRYGWVGFFVMPLLYALTFFFGGRCQHRPKITFLDKTCIHQTDKELQHEGILKLGAFLNASDTMVVCYTDIYLRKLWTVYEVACFLSLHPVSDLILIHTRIPQLAFVIALFTLLPAMRDWLIESNVALMIMSGVCFFPAVGLFYFARTVLRDAAAVWIRAKEFSVSEAKCFCESDRPLVEKNIEMLLKHYSHVDVHETTATCMEIFNHLVRNHLPEALENALPRHGLPYKVFIFATYPLFCAYLMDKVGGNIVAHDGIDGEVCLRFFHGIVTFFMTAPTILQIAMWVASWKLEEWVGLQSVLMSVGIVICVALPLSLLGTMLPTLILWKYSNKPYLYFAWLCPWILLFCYFFQVYKWRPTCLSTHTLLLQRHMHDLHPSVLWKHKAATIGACSNISGTEGVSFAKEQERVELNGARGGANKVTQEVSDGADETHI